MKESLSPTRSPEQTQNKGKSVVKTNKTDIIKSGAISGARNPDSDEAKAHAERYYGLVRSMTTDVKKIAKTTGYSEADIQSIKNYI